MGGYGYGRRMWGGYGMGMGMGYGQYGLGGYGMGRGMGYGLEGSTQGGRYASRQMLPAQSSQPIGQIVDTIKSELGMPPSTSIPEAVNAGMSSLGMQPDSRTGLKDDAVRLAQELNIPIQ